MSPTRIPFTSSCDKENIPVTSKKRRYSLKNGQSASHSIAALRAWLMTRPDTTGGKRPLLQRIVSKGRSTPLSTINGLTNSASTQALAVLPTIQEEVDSTPLLTIYRPSLSFTMAEYDRKHELAVKNGLCHICNESARSRRIIREELERDRQQFLNQSSASFLQSISPPQDRISSDPEREEHEDMKSILLMAWLSSITGSRSCLDFRILTEPEKEKRRADVENLRRTIADEEREKREALPMSPPRSRRELFSMKKGYVHHALIQSIHSSYPSQSLSPHLTIISNPEKDECEGLPRSTQRVMNTLNALTVALSPKRVPSIAITPISIQKVLGIPPKTPAQTPALTLAAGSTPTPSKKVLTF